MFQFTRLVLPHIVLVLFIVAYCLLGAYIFYILEEPFENDRKFHGKNYLSANITEFISFVDRLSSQRRLNLNTDSKHIESLLKEKTFDLLKLYEHLSNEYFINVEDLDEKKRNLHWSYASSILFSFTIITTIGKKFFDQ